jgi:hypothetical protein
MKFVWSMLSCILLCISFVWGQNAPQSETEWHKGNRIVLSEIQGSSSVTSTFLITPEHDLSILEHGTAHGKKMVDGSLMQIGNWLLIKNLPLEKGYEMDELEGEVIELRMLLAILQRVAPAGPTSIRSISPVDKSGTAEIPLDEAYPSEGGVPAPWVLAGTLGTKGDGIIEFDLNLNAGKGEDRMVAQLKGTWQKDGSAPTIADDVSLAGWQVFSLGPRREKRGNGEIFDYGARQSQTTPKTVGDLRKLQR